MKKPTIGLALEGLPFIGLCALVTVALALLDCATGSFVFLVLTVFSVNFFRDPERVIPAEKGLAVSPADGRVVKAATAVDPITGERRKVVCIFMNVFNVHVNRCPVDGTVDAIKYFPGKFLNASLDKASEDNERCAYSIKVGKDEQWTVVQIAGLVARRIVSWTEKGDKLARGQRFGMIKFGSRLDVYLPEAYELAVAVGEKVLAGQSVIAKKQ